MGQAVSTFFTATVIDVARNAWATVVDGVTAFAKWVEQAVSSLVTSIINKISDILEGLKQFFINAWHSVEAFTQKIFGLDPNLKDYVWTKVYDVGRELQKAGIQHMRERLKQQGYQGIDSLSDDKVEKLWDKYMSDHPLTDEQKKKMDETFPPSATARTRMMPSTGVYSKLASEPSTVVGSSIPQHSEEFKLFKDHAITHFTLVLFSPEQLKIGLTDSVSLTPHEERELNRILSI